MFWKIAVGLLTALSAYADARAHHHHLPSVVGSCPAGHTLTTYVVTVTEIITTVVGPSTSGLSTATDPQGTASTPTSQANSSISAIVPTSGATVVPSSACTARQSKTSVSSSQSSSLPLSQSSSLPSSQSSSSPLVGGINKGQATSYGGGDVDGTCMFSTADYVLPAGMYGAALSVDNWDDAAWCGACVSVVGPKSNSIKIMIVNQCPGTCGVNNLDILPSGFEQLADLKVGRINVDWEIVKCDISSPLFLKTKDGSSKYWFSIQVVNSNVPVKSLEVSTDSGMTWQPTIRKDYNFFEKASGGFGVDIVDVRITSITGEIIVVNNVSSISEIRTDAASNFA